MKKRPIALLLMLVLVLAVGILLVVHRRTVPEAVVTEPPASSFTRCYERTVQATADAPYSVHELMKLTFDGSSISGTKSGTQSGPDMTNGYTGTLSGSMGPADAITLLYSYTIEGSKQQEEERYVLDGDNIIKQRFPLIEKNGVLVPDTTQPFVDQVYRNTACT